MDEIKRVLVVDDHLEMVDFLRSLLELSSDNCYVLGVSSAQEGLSALKKASFHLMIVDAQLPEVGGYRFIREARRYRPSVPVILISAVDIEEDRKKAQDLKVYRYFAKPLDSDALIAAVYKVLHEHPSSKPLKDVQRKPVTRSLSKAKVIKIEEVLEALKSDTGAQEAILASSDGDIVVRTDSKQKLDLKAVVSDISSSIRSSARLTKHLGDNEMSAIQYFRGDEQAIYTATIDPHHWLGLFFNAKSGRGKIGTIWFFSRKAISEISSFMSDDSLLENVIADPEESHDSEKEESADAVPAVFPKDLMTDVVDTIEKEERQETAEDERGEETDALPAGGHEQEIDLEQFWKAAIEESVESTEETGISFEEAQRLGLIPGNEEATSKD